MLQIVSKNHDYELDLYFLLWIGDGPFPLGETGALENFFYYNWLKIMMIAYLGKHGRAKNDASKS